MIIKNSAISARCFLFILPLCVFLPQGHENLGLRKITDPNGNSVTVSEDGIFHSSGKSALFLHDLDARREIVTDRLGNTTVYEYDQYGNVVKETGPLGGVTTRAYDEHDNLLSEVDPNGDITTHAYDDRDNKLTTTDGAGNTTTYAYDENNQPTSITDPRGNTTAIDYDATRNPLSMTDALGGMTGFAYDPAGNVAAMTDELGRATRFAYDAAGRQIEKIDAAGHPWRYTYGANGNRLSEETTRTVSGGAVETVVTRYEYDGLNRLTRTINADGTSNTIEYNSIGKTAAVTDEMGRATRHEYDARGNRIRTTYPDGTFEEMGYDAENQMNSMRDRGGRVSRYEYDALGRKTKTIHPDGAFDRTFYDAGGRVTSTTISCDCNAVTRYEYDAVGRKTAMIDALGNRTTWAYDASDNATSMTDALGRTTQYVYDVLNRRTEVIHPDGTREKTEYDAAGLVKEKIDQALRSTRYDYGPLNRLALVTDALSQVTRYAYDEVGNLVSQTDANNHTTAFAHDNMRRRTRRTLLMGMSETMAYDAMGNVVSRTDFNGRTTTYLYDSLNRQIARIPDPALAEPAISFTYTDTGRRASMTDDSGTTLYSYDDRDRLIEKRTPQGTLAYIYDGRGNVIGVQSDLAANGGTNITYKYDSAGRLAAVHDAHAGTTLYGYTSVNTLANMTYPNQVVHSYFYDPLDRIRQIAIDNPGGTLARFSYDLSPTGRRDSITELSGRTVNYAYDLLDRLTGETISNDPSGLNGQIGYNYDPVGNRLARNSSLAAIEDQSFTYDLNNRLTSDQYDASGNTIASGGNSYSYDFENRLTTLNNGAATYVYNGDGDRISKATDGITTRYLIDTNNPTGYAQVVEERTATGSLMKTHTYGLDLISVRDYTTITLATHFYVYDALGSTRQLTDAIGAITDTYTYEAFGNELNRTGLTANLYRFTGEQMDDTLGMQYLRARYYNYDTGRFITMDKHPGCAQKPFSQHRYLYADVNPADNIDPSGNLTLSRLSIGLAISGTVIATAAYSLDLYNEIVIDEDCNSGPVRVPVLANATSAQITFVCNLAIKAQGNIPSDVVACLKKICSGKKRMRIACGNPGNKHGAPCPGGAPASSIPGGPVVICQENMQAHYNPLTLKEILIDVLYEARFAYCTDKTRPY